MPNMVVIDGRLTKDPEERKLKNGNSVVSFTVAYNRAYKPKDSEEWKEETYYFDVESFNPYVQKMDLKKGTAVYVEGELRQDRWENKNGERRSKVYIRAERVEILSQPKEKEEEKK